MNEWLWMCVRIRSFTGPYFLAFGLNTKRYSVFLPIQSEWGKIRNRKTPNTDTFYAVSYFVVNFPIFHRIDFFTQHLQVTATVMKILNEE